MEEILCPDCGTKGKKVNIVTVKSLVEKKVKDNASYQICLNSDCETVYFISSGTIFYSREDLKIAVWYKDSEDDKVPICYCSNLTRGEIKEAVDKGYTTAAEIRKYTGKSITGNCLTENPASQCCHQTLTKEIARYYNKDNI
ncbi:BFD-like [2Fe-2S] binding protein [Halanaerobium saccharolyticum]|uniref:BFD-like [2Fe-2S] binding protein n=1 Tax=Halanaerobium saccharolyticum TaxID=43595 RepID=A0A4R6LCR4_9FIRM|nr:(2Fe-2S)-binding protein [Halanaerobium saccharolyticum]TDO73753.1 BFD-like [2Fe-2S] binding protein [Halanaerobium saccharolyticum]